MITHDWDLTQTTKVPTACNLWTAVNHPGCVCVLVGVTLDAARPTCVTPAERPVSRVYCPGAPRHCVLDRLTWSDVTLPAPPHYSPTAIHHHNVAGRYTELRPAACGEVHDTTRRLIA
jgi:hypothetical protein